MTTTTTNEIVRFETGETYYDRSAGDWDCIFRVKVERRTAKSVWISGDLIDGVQRRGIYVYEGREQIRPFGSYSMCAIMSADRKASDLD